MKKKREREKERERLCSRVLTSFWLPRIAYRWEKIGQHDGEQADAQSIERLTILPTCDQ